MRGTGMCSMIRKTMWLALMALSVTGSGFAFQESEEPQERVLGQPGSKEEMEVWSQVNQASAIEEKGQLAQEYLEQFPEGGYAPYAHEILAFYYQSREDMDQFFSHADQALEELPDEAVLLVNVSIAAAERKKPDMAIERGERAIRVIPNAEAPAQVSAEQWDQEKDSLMSEAHYGVGTGYLLKAFNDRGNSQLMQSATTHLEQAVQLNSLDERAHFRLGFAYQIQQNLDQAVLSYARAAAIGGPNSAMARSYLEKAYSTVYGNTQGIDNLIEEQKGQLEK